MRIQNLQAWMITSLRDYEADLTLNKSKTTVDAYLFDVVQFMKYLQVKGVKRLSSLKPEHITNYLGGLKIDGRSDASLNRYYMSIKSYCRFLRKIKAILSDFTEDVPIPRIRVKAPMVPTREQVQCILDQPDIETEAGVRDRAILELLYSSGLRASELCALKLKDVHNQQVLVSCGKRGKTRSVPITNTAHKWVTHYVERCRGTHAGPLFETVTGKALNRQRLNDMVTRYAKKADVEGLTTHSLRHACATHLLDKGADLRLIQEVLGHSSIASTQRYTHLSSNKIQEMFHNFHPGSR